MSRARLRDNSTAVSLFPFLAVLLCAMGALVIVLIVLTKISRDRAVAEAAARQATEAATTPAADDATDHTLQYLKKYLAQLAVVKRQAEKLLRDDQLELGHLEDHIRRLQDELHSRQLAAAELNSLEDGHVDDREQAGRELARLQELADQRRADNDRLRKDIASKPKSYAIVPYTGRYGTRRQPIYLECRDDKVILQPEGIELTERDFTGPAGLGSPLAAAIRAAREFAAKEHMASAEQAAPYPLLVVRPSGIAAYRQALAVIEKSGFEYGFELVDSERKVVYPPPNPRLAELEFRAIENARRNVELLAAAAPRAFSNDQQRFYQVVDHDDGYDGDEFDADDGLTDAQRRATDRSAAELAAGTSSGFAGSNTIGPQATRGDGDLGTTEAAGADAVSIAPPSPQSVGGAAGIDPVQSAALADSAPSAASESSALGDSTGRRMAGAPSDMADDRQHLQQDSAEKRTRAAKAKFHGKDWAILDRRPGSVPIRRTIQVVVRHDHLAILPEAVPAQRASTGARPAGREIPFDGSTARALPEFAAEVKEHIQDWGIAGNGLYWRPVLELKVGPDGQQRADDLLRLLNDSGMEVRAANVAQQPQGPAQRATR